MKRILIADDDFPIRDWLARCCAEILKDEETDIVTAANGQLALDEFEKKSADILFADIKMPVMDGLELTERVRSSNPDVYIVVLSSYDDFNYARTAFQNKVNEYVLKTEITMGYMENILERAGKHIASAGNKEAEETQVYSFDELMEAADGNMSDAESLELMEKYNIKLPKDPFFCVATYNREKTYERLRLIQEESIYKVFSVRADMAEIFCFSVAGEVSMLYQFQKANLFMKKLAEFNPRHVMCYGRIGSIKENVLSHAAEVLKGLNYRYYTDENIFFAENIKDSISNYKIVDTSIIELYINIIDIKDKKNFNVINNMVAKWFDLLEQNKVLDIAMVKSMCQRIYDALKEEIDVNNIINSSDIINHISKAEKISELRELIMKAYEKNIDNIAENKTTSSTIQKALKYIYSNYATLSGLPEVASEVGLNTEYFSRLFKAETGVNFSAYLNNYRLDRAEKLLKKTDKKLYEIAEETGFSSLSYFSRKFKERFNKTPFDYRE